jgi:hypothetical protein
MTLKVRMIFDRNIIHQYSLNAVVPIPRKGERIALIETYPHHFTVQNITHIYPKANSKDHCVIEITLE